MRMNVLKEDFLNLQIIIVLSLFLFNTYLYRQGYLVRYLYFPIALLTVIWFGYVLHSIYYWQIRPYRKMQVVDFDYNLFPAGIDDFAQLMHEYYVDSKWQFGYKHKEKEFDDFKIVNNIQNPFAEDCKYHPDELESYFSPRRTLKYIEHMSLKGKMCLAHDGSVVGWMLGFDENIFQDEKVFNIGYVCVTKQYRKRTKFSVEPLRRFIIFLNKTNVLPDTSMDKILSIIGYSPVTLMFDTLTRELHKKSNYLAYTVKIKNKAGYLERMAKLGKFVKMKEWDQDKSKNIWIKFTHA